MGAVRAWPQTALAFPLFAGDLPNDPSVTGPYAIRYARTEADLHAVQRLRFEVFNLELNEGLAASYATGRDEDEYDGVCHHLMIIDVATGDVAGTYRLQTIDMARESGLGLYSAGEFDFTTMPKDVMDASVELGRACIAKAHRSLKVLYLLWQGIGLYLAHNDKRYLFGCCSLTSQDPAEGHQVMAYLAAHGYTHPEWHAAPLPALACATDGAQRDPEAAKLPRLMRVYLSLGATICGGPALDAEFGTIDYLALFDVHQLDERTLAYYRCR